MITNEPIKVSWFDRLRAPWKRVSYGATVLPPNKQKSNLALTNPQVMQPRGEPVRQREEFESSLAATKD